MAREERSRHAYHYKKKVAPKVPLSEIKIKRVDETMT